jgi:hypothetical protein
MTSQPFLLAFPQNESAISLAAAAANRQAAGGFAPRHEKTVKVNP